MKLNLFVCVLVISIAAINAQEEAINICEKVADFIFLANMNDCSSYYICVNETPIAQKCDNNLYFDGKAQSCTHSSTNCINCLASTLSYYPLYKTCDKYIMCFAGQPILRKCYDNLQFSETDLNCNLASKVDCVENNCPVQNDIPTVVYVPSYADCNKYYVCMTGQPIAQNCATGLSFNPTCNCCDLAANVACTNPKSISMRSIAMSENIPAQKANIDCPEEGIHFYPHVRSTKYYVCANGHGALLTCNHGLFYDSKTTTCRELRNILLQ
ncbi:peritrophin-48-like [Teleopsis dalmanni]|uniref:peritrophin-48-like n=1 Tax=Teleopsis dalmanni TaxID=139649 RepID=UPI0018CEBD3A|nr:peritrophin-48-like [Teleopsis dalmanni]